MPGLSAQSVDPKSLKGEISHWVWGDYEMKGASDFTLTYPNIKVNYVTIATSDYMKKLQTTAAAGGEMPDVANLEMTPRGTLVNLDIWENLDKAPSECEPKGSGSLVYPAHHECQGRARVHPDRQLRRRVHV